MTAFREQGCHVRHSETGKDNTHGTQEHNNPTFAQCCAMLHALLLLLNLGLG